MASNICISSGSERAFQKIIPGNMYVNGAIMPGVNKDIKADSFYTFGTLGYLGVKLIDASDSNFREYIFEFTPSIEGMSLSVTSNFPVYWVKPITLVKGNLYQVRIVNGVVSWSEVAMA